MSRPTITKTAPQIQKPPIVYEYSLNDTQELTNDLIDDFAARRSVP